MGNLLSSLTAAAESLRSFERAVSVSSNNVANANTPGYVRQQVNFVAQRLQIDQGLPGGVRTEGLLSGRDAYLEKAVRNQISQSAAADQRTTLLQSLEPVFDISSGAGVAGALDAFHSAVSQWSVGPNDTPARQNVLRAAQSVAHAFQTTASALGSATNAANNELGAAVAALNRIGNSLVQLNHQIRSDARAQDDPGIDAQVHAALEELSQYADFTILPANDGTLSVYLGGETPFLLGEKEHPLSADISGTQPVIRDADGRDITASLSGGKLSALANFRNSFLTQTKTDLDRLAKTFADQVSAQLDTGLDANGQSPTRPLFTYSPTNVAATLSVNSLTSDELAAASPGAPGGNANVLALSDLLAQRNIDNFSYTQFFGEIAGSVGRAVAGAQEDQKTQGHLLAQVQSVREEKSKVSLDEEAANLVQFQRAYQASAKLFQTIDEMTQTLIDLKR